MQQGLLVTLLVDQLLVSSLRGAGYIIYQTDDVPALIEQTERQRPDAVMVRMTDFSAPTLRSLVETLRQFPGGASLPIIALGPTDATCVELALASGVDDYLPVDFPSAVFIHHLTNLIQRSHRESELRMTLALVERAKQEWEIGVDSLSELICVLSHDGRVMRTNRTLETWGIGRVQDVRGRTLPGLLKNRFPDFAIEVDNLLYSHWAQIQTGVVIEAELYEPTTDHYFSLQVRPVDRNTHFLEMAEESAAIAIFENITTRKKNEQALADYAAELEQRNQELDAYGHTVAHDLKSPLNLIMGYADMLATFSPDELASDGLGSIQKIIDSAGRMAEMIDQLLLLAATRNATDQVTTLEIDPLVTMALARFEHEITERNIAVEVGAAFPKALGHAPWVVEIFANLIGNAIKYLGSTNPAPTIRIVGQRVGDYSHYEVQDTGVGIEPRDQERLFEMFSRIHPELAEGTGLGLSIVHRMVTRQNGKVGVASTPGMGSTFWFTLPHPS